MPPIPPTPPASAAQAGAPIADLKLVDESASFEDRSESDHISPDLQDAVTDQPTRQGLPLWMFVVGLVLAVVVIGWQAQLAGELEAEVAALEGKLERTNSLLEAHRSHLGEIRGGVYDLSERLDSLRALVDGGPRAGLAESASQSPPVP